MLAENRTREWGSETKGGLVLAENRTREWGSETKG